MTLVREGYIQRLKDRADSLEREAAKLREEKDLWYERWQHTSMAVLDLNDEIDRLREELRKGRDE